MEDKEFRGIKINKYGFNTDKWVYGCLVTRNCDGFKRVYIYDSMATRYEGRT